MAKVGRPKAPVTISFTEEELEAALHCAEFDVLGSIEHLYSLMSDPKENVDINEYDIAKNSLSYLIKLKTAYQRKYGNGSKANNAVTDAFVQQYKRNVELVAKNMDKEGE